MTQHSNELNVKTHDVQRQIQTLAESTIALNKEIRKLNQESTEAARANQADAAKTSLSTRVNVEVGFYADISLRSTNVC
jgi:cell division protein FtsB